MNLLGVRVGRLSAATRHDLLARAANDALTYDHVGSTLELLQLRPSVRMFTLAVGSGDAAFAAAVDALKTWVPHHGIGARVHPIGRPVTLGADVLIELRLGPLFVAVPDRIVAVTDEPDRFGFTYGTLPGHAERGEETFLVERDPDGTIVATVRVDARPATIAARVAAPVVSRLQALAARRYLRAIAEHVTLQDW